MKRLAMKKKNNPIIKKVNMRRRANTKNQPKRIIHKQTTREMKEVVKDSNKKSMIIHKIN